MTTVAQRSIGGRIALDRAGVAAHTGAADPPVLVPTHRMGSRRRTHRPTVHRPHPRHHRPYKPHPYADDPRLQAATDLLAQARAEGRDRRGLGIELAQRLGIPQRTAQRLLGAAEGD